MQKFDVVLCREHDDKVTDREDSKLAVCFALWGKRVLVAVVFAASYYIIYRESNGLKWIAGVILIYRYIYIKG